MEIASNAADRLRKQALLIHTSSAIVVLPGIWAVGMMVKDGTTTTLLIAAVTCIASACVLLAIARMKSEASESILHAMTEIRRIMEARQSKDVHSRRNLIEAAYGENREIMALYQRYLPLIDKHEERLRQAETISLRKQALANRIYKAKAQALERLEAARKASPAIRAQKTLDDNLALVRRQRREAEEQVERQRAARKLTWWFDMTKPTFKEVDESIERMEAARRRLLTSDGFRRTEAHFRDRADQVERRSKDALEHAIQAVPADRREQFEAETIAKSALLLSALSIPVSAWRDVSQAGEIYDALREVNGNYAEMSDLDIWVDTLVMPADQLLGLASLTKGAYFERLVAEGFGGERFAAFNHPDTDIVIDGVAYQIKATDSISYVEGVPDHIPVISTSEIAGVTGSIDGGYSHEDLSDAVDLALGGTILDIGDTAFDAALTGILSGVGGIGIFSIIKAVRAANRLYQESGDATGSLAKGFEVAVVDTMRRTVNMAEILWRGSEGALRVVSWAGRKMLPKDGVSPR